MERNYEEDLSINPEQLDIEWLDQPRRFMHYAKLSAEANQTLRKAEEKVKVVRSELSLEVSKNGQELISKAKPTAGDIEAYYRTHADHIAAKAEHEEAQFEVEMLTNAVHAFHQRKMALENLVRLHGQQYFSGPSEPHDLPAKYQEHRRETVREIQREKTAEKIRPQRRRRTSTD